MPLSSLPGERPLRVGLAGYGTGGRQFHAPALLGAGLEVAAVSTSSAERVEQVHADLPDALVVPHLDALLDVDGLDLVVLATPTGLHAEQAQRVIETGRPLVVDKPLRSGQQVYARGRDLVVLAMVNPGAEVIADGHIHVYAPLRGKAIAGARGNAEARIFAQALEAELISIAGVYRTSDVPLPDNVRGKAAQVRLQSSAEGDKLLLEPIL